MKPDATTVFAPADAALEGLRVMRREPKAVLSWIGVWLLAFLLIALLEVITQAPDTGGHAKGGQGLLGLVRRFGPLWPIMVSTLLLLWIMTTATVFRAVIAPDSHGWSLFRLGRDEGRLAVVTGVGFLVVLAFGSGPAAVLWLVARPLVAAMPDSERWVVLVGTLATVCLEFWIVVRLSLTGIHSFAEGHYHLVGYWRLTRGHFWRLLASYLIVMLEIVVFLIGLAVVALLVSGMATAVGAPRGDDWVRRGLLLALAPVAALLSATLFVAPLIMICACQAFAYRAIAPREGPWGLPRV